MYTHIDTINTTHYNTIDIFCQVAKNSFKSSFPIALSVGGDLNAKKCVCPRGKCVGQWLTSNGH